MHSTPPVHKKEVITPRACRTHEHRVARHRADTQTREHSAEQAEGTYAQQSTASGRTCSHGPPVCTAATWTIFYTYTYSAEQAERRTAEHSE